VILKPPTPASGFVCGTTAQQCYQGLLNATPPLVGPSYASKPTTAPLYQALWEGGTAGDCAGQGVCSNNMPYTLGYSFKPADLSLIAQWIADGAPNN